MINSFNSLKKICESYQIVSLQNLIDAIQNTINNQNCINVSVLGRFKSGKSSFINSLIKENLLPTGIVPVTNVITTVQFGKNKKVIITKTNGQSQEIEINELELYVSEDKNPNNIKKIKRATIETPQLAQINKLKLIDTPGVGSIFKHNSMATKDWLPHIGLSIIVINSNQPLSENDMQLIEEAMLYCPENLILISKVDLQTPEESEQLKTFVEKSLQKRFNKQFPCFLYSIKNDSLKQKLMEDILLPAHLNFEKKITDILTFKLASLRNQCLDYLKIAYNSILKKQAGEDQLKEKIFDEKINKTLVEKELSLIEKSYSSKTRSKIKEHLFSNYQAELTQKIITDFQKQFTTWHGNLNTIARKYEQWCKDSISHELKMLLNKDKAVFDSFSDEPKKHFEQYIGFFRDRLNENISKVLDVNISKVDWKINPKEIETLDISTNWAFDTQIDMLWFLFPMFFLRNAFFRYFLRQIPNEVEKNLYRLSSQLTEIINQEISRLKDTATNYISSEISSIEKMLAVSNNDSDALKSSIENIKKINVDNQ